MACISCGRGFHEECLSNCSKCHPVKEPQGLTIIGTKKRGRPEKPGDEMLDPKSTGRHRAARDYPIKRDEPCEWRGFKNCGGGLEPIVGCLEGKQVQRHHGPIKDPRNNDPGNVHRVCTKCHRRWHARNDPIYNEGEYAKLPHRPLEATSTELAQNELNWKKGKISEVRPESESRSEGSSGEVQRTSD